MIIETSTLIEDKFGEIQKITEKPKYSRHIDYLQLYDKKGRIINTSFYYPYDSVKNYPSFVEDVNGNIIELKERESKRRQCYKYDENGNITEVIQYSCQDSLMLKTIYKYDGKSNMEELRNYNTNGNLSYMYKYKYNNDKQLTEEILIDANGKELSKTKYFYDKKGNNTELLDSNDTQSQKLFFEYDANNNKTKEILINEKNEKIVRYTYKYDNKGNMIELNEYYSDGTKRFSLIYENTYDKYGNWIKRIESENDIPKFLIERRILYF